MLKKPKNTFSRNFLWVQKVLQGIGALVKTKVWEINLISISILRFKSSELGDLEIVELG